ncbi:segregation/condensation protein A [Streptomyces sp. MA25(2023)]|uniref:segregation and condensation protein A n=1 Tax=unclassified Streptomyces TaxID=2593676 RepID=UPI0025AF1AC8|nr:segregation/condensation protein A [Streptomyces sp. MA25(2023)]MDN3257165.1 segregation/condensation protein A [Streptomyces sp. MA25(2023)]
MTSYDASRPGARAGRRRALGRGPGERPAGPVPPVPDASGATAGAEPPGAAPVGTGPSGPGTDPGTTVATEAETAPEGRLGSPRGAGAPVDAQTPDGPPPGHTGLPRTPPGEDTRPSADAEAPHALPEAAPGEDDGVFKVRLANFEGPFDLLLQLISKHKLDVTEVALSKVTDEFMAHIRALGPDWDLDETTEFLVVAATLLDLKAARLLPAAEVEDEADLALLEARDLLFARLLQYRAYKQIAEIFNERLDAEARRYPRTVGLEPHHAELLPEVVISIGPEGFAKLAVRAMQPKPKPQVYVEHIHAPLVSVQEQAGIVVARLKELGEASFRVLVEDTEDTLTVVARFLALLELYREKAVALDQETALGDLLVRWTGGDGDTEPVVTDEFDRPPEAPKEEQKA